MLNALHGQRSARVRSCNACLQNLRFRRWKQSASEQDPPELTVSSDDTAETVKPLELLSRPVGVTKRPSATPQSWEEKRADMLDYEKHIERRRHLIKEASQGYFQDYHALRHHEGKTWIAPKSLIRADKALYFPDVAGVSLTPHETVHTTSLLEGRISIVSMISTTRSEEHAKSFTTPALEAHQWNPLFRFLQINLQENPLKGFLVSMFLSSIRARIPAHLQSTYLVSRQNMEYLREPMGMTNKHIGYIYLVDESCKIRWSGCGFATEDEDLSLKNCTRVLLERLDRTKNASSSDGGPLDTDNSLLSSS